MMRLSARLARLEQAAPPDDNARGAIDLCLAPDLCARIDAAKVAGSFPQSLSNDDLRAFLRAVEQVGATHDRP